MRWTIAATYIVGSLLVVYGVLGPIAGAAVAILSAVVGFALHPTGQGS